jgi:hypothetical protein
VWPVLASRAQRVGRQSRGSAPPCANGAEAENVVLRKETREGANAAERLKNATGSIVCSSGTTAIAGRAESDRPSSIAHGPEARSRTRSLGDVSITA